LCILATVHYHSLTRVLTLLVSGREAFSQEGPLSHIHDLANVDIGTVYKGLTPFLGKMTGVLCRIVCKTMGR
jgi:hypothetical protein